MPRILSIDYGLKRSGVAVTDPLQIIATALDTIDTPKLLDFLKAYVKTENVERIVIGMPVHADGNDTHSTPAVRAFIKTLNKEFPTLPVSEADESYSSKEAVRAMSAMGMKKSQRRDKRNIDKIAAVIILQQYLQSR